MSSSSSSFPSYSDLDVQVITTKTNNMMSEMGTTSADDFISKLADLDQQTQFIQASEVAKHMYTASELAMVRFRDATDMLAQLNESYNANRYIVESTNAEHERIKRVDSLTKNDIYKMRQGVAYTTYMEQYYKFVTGLLTLTMFVTLLLLIPASMWRKNELGTAYMVVIDGIVLFLYIIILFFIVLSMARRRKTAGWDKYYWKISSSMKDELEGAKSSWTSCDSD
jgi:hypothetical protein